MIYAQGERRNAARGQGRGRYGGGGAIGSAVATVLASEGAKVFVAGRTLAKLQATAHAINDAGGTAEAAEVDALDEQAVEQHASSIVDTAGRIDISVNAIGVDNGEQGVPLVAMTPDEFTEPIVFYIRNTFITARTVARHMAQQKSGVILMLFAPMARMPTALTGSFSLAAAGVETLARQLAAELGPDGVRVVCLRLTGIPQTATDLGSHTKQVWDRAAEHLGVPFDELLEGVGGGTALQRPLTVRDAADVAAFLASDRATGMTGTVANVTAGVSGTGQLGTVLVRPLVAAGKPVRAFVLPTSRYQHLIGGDAEFRSMI
jgi:NAD(P)-dependent dehydrogenase (short-subunit alcohol dehydrogenase family)